MTGNGAVSHHHQLSPRRFLALLGVLALAFSLLPQAADAQESPDTPVESPVEEPPAEEPPAQEPPPPVPEGPAEESPAEAACPVDAPDAGFSDQGSIPRTHEPNVRCAVALGIVSGFANGTYGPDRPVRRDQMATFIAQTLDAAGVDLPAATAGTFTDVPASNTHASNVSRLAAVGIVQGGPGSLPAHQYGPSLRTRRDQMASFLMRAAGYALHDDIDHFNDTQQRFSDVPATNAHFPKVNAAAAEGLAGGIGNGLYAPSRETRRDQLASFVMRLMHYVEAESGPAVDITLAPASGAPGAQVTGTLGGEVDAVEGITISGPCVDNASNVVPANGTFGFNISSGAAAGPCAITFTVAFNDGSNPRTITRSFEVDASPPPPPTPQVDITIASASAWPGSLVTTDVTGETHRIREIAVSGPCLESRSAPPDEERFTFIVAEGAASGSCSVSFAISFIDGSPTQTVTRSVTIGPRPQVGINLTTSSGPAGTRVNGTATGDLDRVQRIGVTGPCVADQSELTVSNGSFSLEIRGGAAPGPCNIVFDVIYNDGGSRDPITRTFQVTVPTTPEIAISTSPLPGRHVTGRVGGDLNRISQIRVSGPCIPTTYTLTLTSGVFDFGVGGSAAPGPCTLSFAVTFTDGSSQTIPRTYNVNRLVAGGPNLTHAVVQGSNTIVYHFDRTVATPRDGECNRYPEDTGPRFSVITDRPDPRYPYFGTGVRRHATNLTVQGRTVVATFPSGVVASAQLATARNDAVVDAGNRSRCSYAANAALPGQGDGTTARPDLLSVSRTVTGSGNVVRYVFDQHVDQTDRYAQLYNSELFLVDNDGGLSRPLDARDGNAHPGLSPCQMQYVRTHAAGDTIQVTNCYTNAQVLAAVLATTQPMPPRHMAIPPTGPNYQPVNTDGITPSHPEGAATFPQ